MKDPARIASTLPLFAAALLSLSALVMWWPALGTPFWGDDYVFLHAARATNVGGAPWWSDFWPTSPPRFWRPLSQEGYWRWVDVGLDGSAFGAHVVSLCLHVAATLALALFAFRLASACRWPFPGRVAALSGAIYGALTLHLLPVHWAAAANNAMLTLFTMLLLASWVSARDAVGIVRILLLASLPIWLSLALLSKESAALTPALMLLVLWFVAARRPDRAEFAGWCACVAVVLAWLVLRARFTADTDAAYDLQLGGNVLRNALSLVAWMSNVPREAMRMTLTGDRLLGLAWVAATALPMVAVWLTGWLKGRKLLSLRQWACVGAFVVTAYTPYFLFVWNSYEYYAAISIVMPVVALGRSLADSRAVLAAVLLVGMSSWVAVEGSRRIDHPGLIGRAHEAESILSALEREKVFAPIHVLATDAQRFYAVGRMGLAWRLGLPPEQIHLDKACPSARICLIIVDGHWRWDGPPIHEMSDLLPIHDAGQS